jgi:hypothetical protein
MDAMIICEACGRAAETGADWFTVHFGVRNLELLATATGANIRYLGEHSVCSKECLIQLVRDWADNWKSKRAAAAAN